MAVHHYHVGRQTLWLACLDVVCLIVGMVSAIWIRLGYESLQVYLFGNLNAWLVFFFSIPLANYLAGSYGIQISLSRFNILVNWMFSLGVGMLVLSVTSYAWLKIMLGRGVLALSILNYSLLWLALRVVLYGYLFSKRPFLCRVAVLGEPEACEEMRRTIESPDIFPAHEVVAVLRPIDERAAQGQGQRADATGAGTLVIDCPPSRLRQIVHSLDVDILIMTGLTERELVGAYPHVRRLRFQGVMVIGPMVASEMYSGRIPLELVDETWLMQMSSLSASPAVMRVKRLIDIFGALLAVLVCLPLLSAVALAVKLTKPSASAFYTQDRVGRFGRIFRIFKYRTMVENAEAQTGAMWSPDNDKRITRLGAILRKFRLDELPQLFNILRGDMSLVGPRPERPEIVRRLEAQIPFYGERENVMPGLTGWAQIRYPYGSSIEDARTKLEYDLYYIKNMSLSLDLQIVLRTVRTVFLGMERRVRWRAEAVGEFIRGPRPEPPAAGDKAAGAPKQAE